MTIVAKNPHSLKFTQNIVANYELGVKVIYWLITFTAKNIKYVFSLLKLSTLHYVSLFISKGSCINNFAN